MGYSQNKLTVYNQCRAKMIPCVYHTRKLGSTLELATTIASSTGSSTFLGSVVHARIQRLLSWPAVFPVRFLFFFFADHIFLFAVV